MNSAKRNGAIDWIKTLPEDSGRQAAVMALVDSTSYQNPELSVQWAEKITDNQGRGYRLENAARRWLESDETAAMAWIKQSSLSQQVKDRLLKSRQ